MPSTHSSNGSGSDCQRISAWSRSFRNEVIVPAIRCVPRIATESIIEITIIFSGLRRTPVDMRPISGMFQRPWRSGTICITRSRARSTLAKCRYSFHRA